MQVGDIFRYSYNMEEVIGRIVAVESKFNHAVNGIELWFTWQYLAGSKITTKDYMFIENSYMHKHLELLGTRIAKLLYV